VVDDDAGKPYCISRPFLFVRSLLSESVFRFVSRMSSSEV